MSRFVALLTLVLAPDALAQVDPLAAQKRATERIDAFVEHVRKTADIETLAPDLALEIPKRLGYEGLVRLADASVRRVEKVRMVIDMHQAKLREIQASDLYSPKTRRDVAVHEWFVAPSFSIVGR